MQRKILVPLALFAMSAGAHAEWKPLAQSAFGTMTYDTASVRPEQGRTHMQYRIDFPAPRKNGQGKTYSSATMDVAVDCKAQTVTLLDLQTNTGQKGQGQVVERQAIKDAKPEQVALSSSNASVFKAACPGVAIAEKAPSPAANASSRTAPSAQAHAPANK
jgi:hypothetical protein